MDHAAMKRGVLPCSAPLGAAGHGRKRPVWARGRMEKTTLRGKGPGRDRSRAVDTTGPNLAFLRPEHGDERPRALLVAARCGLAATLMSRSPALEQASPGGTGGVRGREKVVPPNGGRWLSPARPWTPRRQTGTAFCIRTQILQHFRPNASSPDWP